MWDRTTINAFVSGTKHLLFDGYISHLDPVVDDAAGAVTIDLRGVDASYAMGLHEKCKVWKQKTYEKIAEEIIKAYELRAVLPPPTGGKPNGDSLPSLTQRSSDLRFLRELARRKGYEFYVRGASAHFHPAALEGSPQKTIAVRFGKETNCHDLRIRMDGTRPTVAAITRVDPATGEPDSVKANASGLAALGTRDHRDRRAPGVPETVVLARRRGAVSAGDMKDYVQGILRRSGFWIHAEGSLNVLEYGSVIHPGRTVGIVGLGKDLNGLYYVRKVVHQVTSRGYTLRFEADRNGRGETGTEDLTREDPEAVAPRAAGAGEEPDPDAGVPDGNQVRA
jgi:phage protein D